MTTISDPAPLDLGTYGVWRISETPSDLAVELEALGFGALVDGLVGVDEPQLARAVIASAGGEQDPEPEEAHSEYAPNPVHELHGVTPSLTETVFCRPPRVTRRHP